MGYHTDLGGSFTITPPLEPNHLAYLKAFQTRRMKRNTQMLQDYPDPVRDAAELPLGQEGEFFVGDQRNFGQIKTPDIINYNQPPASQPDTWCPWVPNDDGTELVWNEGDQPHEYIEWLKYMVTTFFVPWGYVLNGSVDYEGGDSSDRGVIRIDNNIVDSAEDVITNRLR